MNPFACKWHLLGVCGRVSADSPLEWMSQMMRLPPPQIWPSAPGSYYSDILRPRQCCLLNLERGRRGKIRLIHVEVFFRMGITVTIINISWNYLHLHCVHSIIYCRSFVQVALSAKEDNMLYKLFLSFAELTNVYIAGNASAVTSQHRISTSSVITKSDCTRNNPRKQPLNYYKGRAAAV